MKKLLVLICCFAFALLVPVCTGIADKNIVSAEERIPAYEDITQMTDEEIAAKEEAFLQRAKEANTASEGCSSNVNATTAFAALAVALATAFALSKIRVKE